MALFLGNQTLGRGELHVALFKPGTHIPANWRFVGNAPGFSITIDQEKLDHFDSTRGVRIKDKSIILQVDYSGSITLDDINNDNLALFFFGSKSVVSQTAATAQTESFTGTIQGYSHQLGLTSGNPTGVRKVSNVVVAVGGANKTLGTDFTVDADRGIVYITEGGTITDGATITVTYDRALVSRRQVISGSTQVECALRFISYNPQGEKNDIYCPYVRLGPNGDFELIADEWQQLPLSVEILSDTFQGANKSAIYVDGQPYVA